MMELSSDQLNQVAHKLQLHGYKLTKQRAMTLEVLVEEDTGYVTAEEIFMKIKRNYSSIGLATVYRTLDLFSELRIVRKFAFNDKSTRFGFRGEESEHSPSHLICKDCGSVEKVNEAWLSELERHVSRELGFQVLDQQLDFIGTYATCHEKKCKRWEERIGG
ncbi:Fur family transcriptional regulator [Paenibacillus contaminans]|uniref:Transcriptional repressor n=1 Tax=Paenibacillus contaminans TaxID=450362 RepID=A0A329MPX9_9BACL|nr:Fur family transcriptional regulator [Paenibacillus contaminans]RAV21662.1 transcriptional repressor [Paenibacillus contaminans]